MQARLEPAIPAPATGCGDFGPGHSSALTAFANAPGLLPGCLPRVTPPRLSGRCRLNA